MLGNKINLKAQNLNIESLQDTMTYKGKQMNVSGQVTVGYGFSASGSYNQSKVNADYASVKTQAGLFAGDEGFDVEVKKHTDLKGAVITSSNQAEQQNKNRFSTGILTYSDIENHSSHNASGFGLSGGVTVSGGEAPKEVGGVKLKQIGQNHKDDSSKVEFGGVAGVGSQGNWGIAKGLATALAGYVNDKGSENGYTTSAITTSNIQIQDNQAQQSLTGKTAKQTAEEINRAHVHQDVNKTDVAKVRSDLEQDLAIAGDFVDKLSERGDEIHYKMEKNEDSLFSIQNQTQDCNHLSCLDFNKDNSQELKEIIYGEAILTDEQARLLSKVATAGMLNLERKDKVSSAILYDDDLGSLSETGVIANRGSAGKVNEFLFTIFERFRAWADVPSVFGASNATRDKVQILKKLDEYNAYVEKQRKSAINATSLSHSLGVSGDKNTLNWARHLNLSFPNTEMSYLHLGGSYPSEEIDKEAKALFKNVKTRYIGVDGDTVYSGILGYFIGNNKNATPNRANLPFLKVHSEANQNINNLHYIYKIDANGNKENEWKDKEKLLNDIYLNGIRKFNNLPKGE